MQFSFTDEQNQFRDVVARFLREQSPATAVRVQMATERGWDTVVWGRFCTELGAAGVHIPEAYGGQGFGYVELGILLEEMGKALFCAPFFSSSVLAAEAILQAGSETDKQSLLPGLASGEERAALAVTEQNGRWDVGGVELQAAETDGGLVLNGRKKFVIDGGSADQLVVVGRQPGSTGGEGITLAQVAADAAGISISALKSVDETRKLAAIDFVDVKANPLGEPGGAAEALDRTLTRATVGLANEMAGGAQQLLDSAIAYCQLRMQFGRRIGSFQAIKHRCADMLLEVEMTKSAAYQAAEGAAADAGNLAMLASIAKASAAETYMQTAASTIQLHGGIGFTWDNDTHLWYKRAKASEVLFGDAAFHRERLLAHWQED